MAGASSSRGVEETPGQRPRSVRATVQRMPERGAYSSSVIREILEDGMFCHVGIVESGSPVVIPMAYGIHLGELVIHGIAASRLLTNVRSGFDVCVTVTVLDGLVLAQSAFDHSMNYRSVVVFGRARWLRSGAAKLAALRSISEHLLPGRWADVRPPSDTELRRTHVLAIPLDEASAKVRAGPPSADDVPWDTWTGVLPARLTWCEPESDGRSPRDAPEYVVRRCAANRGRRSSVTDHRMSG
jgi:uncharacterized protein